MAEGSVQLRRKSDLRCEAQVSILQRNIVKSSGSLVVFLEEIRNASAAKVVQVNDVLDRQKRVLILGVDLFLLSWGVSSVPILKSVPIVGSSPLTGRVPKTFLYL